MGARQKLNAIAVIGAFLVAAVIGFAMDSILAFVIAFAMILGYAVESRDIRPDADRRSHRRRK